MTIVSNLSKQFIGLVCTAGITAFSTSNEVQAQEQTSFSPRAYCIQTGGIVSETNDPNVYVCFYHTRGKGVVVNTAISQSVPVDLPTTQSQLAQLTKKAFNKTIAPKPL